MSKVSQAIDAVVRSIPEGCCASYGQVGGALENPVSGLIVGKILAFCEPDLPWWRVVGADGSLLTARRDPALAVEQRARLEAEGVRLEQDRVLKQYFVEELLA